MFSKRRSLRAPEEIGKRLAMCCIQDMDAVPRTTIQSEQRLVDECHMLMVSIYMFFILEHTEKDPDYYERALGVFILWEKDAYNVTNSEIFDKRLGQYSEIAIEHMHSGAKGSPSEELGRTFHFNRCEGRAILSDASDFKKSTRMATIIWNQALSKAANTIASRFN